MKLVPGIIAAGLLLSSPPAFSQSIPVQPYRVGKVMGYAPDWSRISFWTLPPIQSGGSIKFNKAINQKVGYDLSRSWLPGDTADKYLKLGDVSAFGLEYLSLNDIDRGNQIKSDKNKLSTFSLPGNTPIKDLVSAIPGLGEKKLFQVPPLFDLSRKLPGFNGFPNWSIQQALKNSIFKNAKLSERLDLSKYSISSIPGLYKTPLGQIPGWQGSLISQVPGLNKLPFSFFPNKGLLNVTYIALTDLTWGQMEGGDSQADSLVISGSGRKGQTVPVPCPPNRPCSYLELSDYLGKNGLGFGKRWVSGLTQKVPGGEGLLKSVNGGQEPAGILVFGSPFKVVLLNVDESRGKANFGLYFRFCAKRWGVNLGCTPYFIGPVPWLPAQEKQPIIIKV